MDPITPVERERLTSYLTETRRRLLETVQSLSPAQLAYKPGSDHWSAAQVVEHLAMAEGRVLIRVDAMLESPEPKQSAWQGRDDALIDTIRIRESRVQAPESVRPAGQLRHEEALRQFDSARGRVIDFATTTQAPLRSVRSAHPIFGVLDCYQWLLSVAAHTERHHAQILEVMADANFPRAVA